MPNRRHLSASIGLEGQNAYSSGSEITTNPYDSSTETIAYQSWEEGWNIFASRSSE